MHQVVERTMLSPNVTRLIVEAGRIAKVRQPGQFVIVRRAEGAERIPLTIADADPDAGTITLVVQAVGKTSVDLCVLRAGDTIRDVAGPLGRATELIERGRAICVGGGVGTAVVHPLAQGLAQRGVAVTSVIGGRAREWVIFEPELRRYGDVRVCTDDGSYGRHGFVTDELRDLLEAGTVDHVYAVGPVPMMAAVSELTRGFEVATTVSLNAIMVDGTGMCGGCRVKVDGQTAYACVDGPEFDGHTVDFRQLADRLAMYRDLERRSFEGNRCLIDALADASGTGPGAAQAPEAADPGSAPTP
jgi:ferredoxin--NADP+ reductase